jgi:prepilin-type N-terminal cleavage/methylation domain-containing protein/prepilin-type processing-associated H-X9-DG protein
MIHSGKRFFTTRRVILIERTSMRKRFRPSFGPALPSASVIARRRAFTLVELLVVITIIGILISLLMPAVQSAREAARKTQCLNNVKQLALGCLSHEHNFSFLPSCGWVWYWAGDPDRGAAMKQPGGWIYNILPFIEQRGLHDMGAGLPMSQKSAQLSAAAQIPLALLMCPTRRPVMVFPNSYSQCNMNPVPTAAHSDYAACSGTMGPTFWAPPQTGDPSFADVPGYVYPTYAFDGAMSCLTLMKMASITDGASNTYLLGEKYLIPDNYFNGIEATDNNPVYAGYDWDYQRWSTTNPKQDTPGLSDYYCFGSAHPSGFNMAFCDGSVHSISFAIDPLTHQHLCCRNDRQLLDQSKY